MSYAHPLTVKDIIVDEQEQERIESLKHQTRLGSKVRDRQVGGEHYKRMGVEPWDVIDTWPLEQRIGYYRGNALKYLMRCGSKDKQLQEINKGIHYLDKLVEVLKESQ